MKKNLISIVILALMIVNVALTAILMFSVMSTSRKTAALVDNITTALDLELTDNTYRETHRVDVPISDMDTYSISEKMTIPLQPEVSEDGREEAHYFITNLTLSMNTKADGYKEYGESLETWEPLIKSRVEGVIGQCTLTEARNNQDEIKEEILKEIQALLESEFVFDVSFSDTMIQ